MSWLINLGAFTGSGSSDLAALDPSSALLLRDDGPTRGPKHETNRTLRNGLAIAEFDEDVSPYEVAEGVDLVIAQLTASGGEIDLPTTPATGQRFGVKAKSLTGQTLTIDGNGKNLDGSGSTTMTTDYSYVEFVYDGTEWGSLADTR